MDKFGSPLTITLKACQFANLTTRASIDVSFNGTVSAIATGNERPADRVLGITDLAGGVSIAPGYSRGYPPDAPWDLMVPQ